MPENSFAFPARVRLAEGMRIAAWDPADQDTATACYQVYLAAHAADELVEPPNSARIFRTFLTKGHGRTPHEVWAAAGPDGAVVAYYVLELPDLENRDRAFFQPYVHPAARRRGTGRELLRHAASRAAASGRSVFDGVALSDSDGEAFARRVGATVSIEEVRRIQDLRKIPPGLVASLRETAGRAAAGYRLMTWTGPVPDEYAGQLAAVFNAFNDAPQAEGWEDEMWDADRVRERTYTLPRAGCARSYSVAAIDEATGEMAAITEVTIDPERPDWAHQQLTAVTRAHRGHRLGLLVKTAMLEWLAEAEPKLERVATGNAAANEHMIAVNEMLGYEVLPPSYRFYELAVGAVR